MTVSHAPASVLPPHYRANPPPASFIQSCQIESGKRCGLAYHIAHQRNRRRRSWWKLVQSGDHLSYGPIVRVFHIP